MMQQQINFLRPHFLPKKTPLSAATILVSLAALLIVLTVLSYKTQIKIQQHTQKLLVLQNQQKQVTKKIDSMENIPEADIYLLNKESELREEIAVKETLIKKGLEINIENKKHFATVLQQIAKAKVEGVWLTKIVINNQNKPWIVEGYINRSSPSLISKYINKLASSVKHKQKLSLDHIGEDKVFSNGKPQQSQAEPLFFRLSTRGKQ
jgi:hypothetical protein